MLYIIGLGLGDADDVTVKGAAAISRSSKVFLEMYTAILGVDSDALVRGAGVDGAEIARRRRFPHTPLARPPRLQSTARSW